MKKISLFIIYLYQPLNLHLPLCIFFYFLGTMVNPGGSTSNQPPPVGTGPLSWKRCAGCGAKIVDRFLLYTMDSYWHSRCLKCSCCQAQLGEIGTSCFTKSGMILCRNDYIRWAHNLKWDCCSFSQNLSGKCWGSLSLRIPDPIFFLLILVFPHMKPMINKK